MRELDLGLGLRVTIEGVVLAFRAWCGGFCKEPAVHGETPEFSLQGILDSSLGQENIHVTARS